MLVVYVQLIYNMVTYTHVTNFAFLEFITRKISNTELKLLNSPFSQKLVREPKVDFLMSDLSIDSGTSNKH